MTKLFLSYSRKDEAKARRFTLWLEHEGYVVWRDEDDIGGGASFSQEIEKALKDCGAILVLWSAHAVQSAWVRDEAGYGRDNGKLIPFSIDRTEPPLGFRQFQSIDLSSWRGHNEPPNADRIRQAIARITNIPQEPALRPEAARWPKSGVQKRVLAGGVALVAAVLLIPFLWLHWSNDREIEIAVLPSQQSPDRAMAADYANVAAADLAAFLPRRFDRATVVAPGDASGRSSGYRMEISTDPRGAAANATLTLTDKDGHTTLWSDNWTVADAAAVDLKAEVSASASKAALCLTEATGGESRLSQPALGLYLSGCTGLGGTKLSDPDFVTIFERVTKLAPNFAPGWGYLALSRSWIASGLKGSSPAAYAAALKDAREAIFMARKLDPNSATTYDAEFHLIGNDPIQALKVLDKGASIDPENGPIEVHISDELMHLGRTSDSVQAAQRAVQLEPDSPYARSTFILALVYSGEFSKAKTDIAEARKKWPNDHEIDRAEFSLQYRYGDPRTAQQLLPRFTDLSDAEMDIFRKVIAARLDPSPAKVDEAISALRARWPGNNPMRNNVLMALGNFGRVDEAYQLLEEP
ncbi:MAG TPA: TIR domain-containing protein, partial [Sphingomicrobium sp.]|nr:TIR domain-containing protein [Sphingomicrobium sp.]